MTLRPPSDADFQRWLRDATLSREQIEVLRSDLSASAPVDEATESVPLSSESRGKGLDLLTVAYYAGGCLILAAMAWFLGSQWDHFAPRDIFLTTGCYAALLGYLGWLLRFRKGYPKAGGILITCAVWMVPIIVYALEDWAGIWPGGSRPSRTFWGRWENDAWIITEIATITAGILALRFVRFPFLVCPVAVSAWLLSIDMSELLRGDACSFHERAWITVAVGALMLVASFLADRRFEMDLSFWGYFFGLGSFWGGLTCQDSGSEWGKLAYASLNLVLVLLSVYLNRRVFLAFGSVGLLIYFYHLADGLFENSPFFPFAVAFLGLAIIVGAVCLQRFATRISGVLDRYRPARMRR